MAEEGTMDIIKVLKQVNIFEGLSAEELSSIATLCENRSYKAHELIFAEKSEGEEIYIVTKGQVRIELSIQGKTDHATIHRVGKGELFGELVLVNQGTRSGTARTETECETLTINGNALLALFGKNERIGYVVAMNLASLLATRLRKTNLQLIACLLWE